LFFIFLVERSCGRTGGRAERAGGRAGGLDFGISVLMSLLLFLVGCGALVIQFLVCLFVLKGGKKIKQNKNFKIKFNTLFSLICCLLQSTLHFAKCEWCFGKSSLMESL